MQRLITRLVSRLLGPRRRRVRRADHGGVSVTVALLMIPVLGFAAVALDAAGLYATKAQLQNGADAAALAVAQNCARRACGTPAATAAGLAAANMITGSANAAVSPAGLSPSTGQVTVTTSTTRTNVFAGVLGSPSTPVTARATARWGTPSGGTAVLPLTFSLCEWRAQTGLLFGLSASLGLPASTTAVTILFTKTSNTGCTGPSGNIVPGGFGWVDPNAGGCQAISVVAGVMSSSTGNSPPGSCSASAFAGFQNKTVLLPIFDSWSGTGNNATYRVYAYAAFTITGYYFAGQYGWNNPCSGNARCIRGYFTGMVSLDSSFTYSTSAPDLGAEVVVLTS